jgi:hypothetical protein
MVEFRLLYSGRVLGASRTDTRAALKHEIRKTFHPQLRRLWDNNKNLRSLQSYAAFEEELHAIGKKYSGSLHSKALADLQDKRDEQEGSFVIRGRELLVREWNRFGYRFLPLITEKHALKCSLDILFLRPEEPGLLINSGDIDNRVKTVFDALRIPKNSSETGDSVPTADEDPFFCLLEDDKLISEVRIVTDQLLLLPRENEIKANDAFLVIEVKVLPTQTMGWF